MVLFALNKQITPLCFVKNKAIMKNRPCSIFVFFLFVTLSSSAQIGTPFVNDVCNDLLFSQDGSFIS